MSFVIEKSFTCNVKMQLLFFITERTIQKNFAMEFFKKNIFYRDFIFWICKSKEADSCREETLNST